MTISIPNSGLGSVLLQPKASIRVLARTNEDLLRAARVGLAGLRHPLAPLLDQVQAASGTI